MGEYYGGRVENLLRRSTSFMVLGGSAEEFERHGRENREGHVETLLEARDEAIGLIVELIRYQDWTAPSKSQET